MKIAWFGPGPRSASGVADYGAQLAAALRRFGEVGLGERKADVALYHIGNNRLHQDIYRRAMRRPGVVTLHDAVLQHFFLGALSRQEYIEEFVHNYGEWNRGLAEDLWNHRARSAADPRYFDYPMLKRLARSSRAIVVHNPAAARLVREHHRDARIFEIPHYFAPPPTPGPIETLRFRRALGLGGRTLLVGVFGYLRESKRLPAIVRAMKRVWAAGADARLLIQGAFASSNLERALAAEIDGDPRILRAGFLGRREFWKWAAAADICVNLRFPTAAETSGIAVSMMGIGKAVAFTEGEEIARIPEDACLRVDRGLAEEEMLSDILRWLAADREAAMEIGRRAAKYIEREHKLERVAAQYWEVLSGHSAAAAAAGEN
ncbi:MAG TPA: glycosyltransferase family 4 protein [Bryobacteraceae bacterium]|nr:glycosyltransferase family 4 protein [Bryobacteraceae bacterium]